MKKRKYDPPMDLWSAMIFRRHFGEEKKKKAYIMLNYHDETRDCRWGEVKGFELPRDPFNFMSDLRKAVNTCLMAQFHREAAKQFQQELVKLQNEPPSEARDDQIARWKSWIESYQHWFFHYINQIRIFISDIKESNPFPFPEMYNIDKELAD